MLQLHFGNRKQAEIQALTPRQFEELRQNDVDHMNGDKCGPESTQAIPR